MFHGHCAGANPAPEGNEKIGVDMLSDSQRKFAAEDPTADPDAADTVPVEPYAGGLTWRLPPVRWGGNLTTDVRADKIGDQAQRLRLIDIYNIKASSYIYAPWFALVGGGLGLVGGRERVTENTGFSTDETRRTRSTAVTGNGDLTLFPVSRFPFNAYFDVSDSRASGEPITDDITNTRLGVRQSYRPLEGGDNYIANFNRSTLESPSFGRDIVNAFEASVKRNNGPQSLDVVASHTSNTRSSTDEHTALNQIHARNTYTPEPELSVESLASFSNNDYRLLSAGVPLDSRSSFVQASTFATWRPEDDSPLYVTGGARLFRSSVETNADKAQTLTLSGNLAATYALSRQTSVAASASVTQLATDTDSRLVTTQTGSVTRIGDPVAIFGSSYTWNTGANVSNQTGVAEGNRQSLGGLFGHNITRNVLLGTNSQLVFGLGQSASASYDTVTKSAQTLGNNASASWRVSSGAATSGYVSLVGTDSRTTGINANDFQMINFQMSGQVQLSQVSYAAANLTAQAVRQSTPNAPRTGTPGNSSGNVSYFKQHAFGVPRLRYSALYGINESQFKSRLQGDVDAPRERVNQSFEQRLDYNLGRLGFRLSMRFARLEGRSEALIFFRMVREFGSF